jgi:ABC-type dipeptide/oligopeptide/nickel transport system permease subunit
MIESLRQLLRHRLSGAGMAIVSAIAFMAVFAPLLSPHDPYRQDMYHILEKPSKTHWLGTDNLGRDVLSRVIYGSRVSLYVGVVSTVISVMIGILVGLIAGFSGGVVDDLLMRITDAFMCFPFLIFVLALASALGPGINNVILSLSLLGWTGFARIIRGQVLVVREMPFIEAARSVGMPEYRIILHHVLPNSIAPVIVAASIFIGRAILTESGTAFLGLGVQPPIASWGRELRVAYSYMTRAPYFSIAPGFLITLTVLAFHFVGDGLRDTLDPWLRGYEKGWESMARPGRVTVLSKLQGEGQ